MLSSSPRKTQLTTLHSLMGDHVVSLFKVSLSKHRLLNLRLSHFSQSKGASTASSWSLRARLGPWELVLALDPSLSRSYHSCFLKVWIQRQFLWEPALFNPLGQWGIHCKCYKGKETTLHILSRKHGVFHFLFSFQKSHLLILWSWRNCKVFTW